MDLGEAAGDGRLRGCEIVVCGGHAERPQRQVRLHVPLRDAFHGDEPVLGAAAREAGSDQQAAEHETGGEDDGGEGR